MLYLGINFCIPNRGKRFILQKTKRRGPPKGISEAKRRVEYLENLDFDEKSENVKKEHTD